MAKTGSKKVISAEVAEHLLINDDMRSLANGHHHDPFALLGRHRLGNDEVIRLFLPHAETVCFDNGGPGFDRVPGSDFFVWRGAPDQWPRHYRLSITTKAGHHYNTYDPYSFLPAISDFDLHLFGEGRHWQLYRVLGAQPQVIGGVAGVRFATWAPNAERVSVVGSFNDWDGRRHPMQSRGGSGVWELFIPELTAGDLYKFEIRNRDSKRVMAKTDPYGQQFEHRPATAAIVTDSQFQWQDGDWLQRRAEGQWLHQPASVFEVHLGSWQRDEHGGFLNYRELAHRLVDHVSQLGFSHIELLPITEHPFDGSWGYQTTGYFAPTSRYGSPDDFRYFVEHCHRHNIGVILDWVPAHFPKDDFALARFDGSALYEHEDPRRGEHRDWGTLIYNYGRNEIRNFLIASALYWLEEFHLDGLRVDAVASMLYLDYSREKDDWVPNIHGGNENLEALAFLRELNEVAHGRHPGVLVIAEESTAWPQVTRPTVVGGLGFSMKWNMGWMHDTLSYMQLDPIYRRYHHDHLTFGLLYSFSENFVLPFSHDEVVHGKGSMIGKMPGDDWQRFANLRLLYTYQFTYPGKKLLFMGSEFAQWSEWNHDTALDWALYDFEAHRGIHRLVSDLNHLYRSEPALHQHDFEPQGFAWIDCHDSAQSVISYLRRSDQGFVVVAFNFTPLPRDGYRIGVPEGGHYRECFNSDSAHYGGANIGNGGGLQAEEVPWMGYSHSVVLTLPPLSGVVLQREG